MSRPRSPFRLLLAFALLIGCKVDESILGPRFLCDSNHPESECGTTREGVPMTCYGGRQIGAASDFCVERCGEQTDVSPDSGSVCLASHARLDMCRPSEKTADDPDGCGRGLACYRTDLFRDEGVCLAMHVCTTDADCTDPVLSTCGGSYLAKEILPGAPFDTTNLQCVMTGCDARGAACPSGETCLPKVVPSSFVVPDVCVPNCDSQLNCPPNYYCWARASGGGAPKICIPGLPGQPCGNSVDCMVGDCLPTGTGRNICAVPCQQHEECLVYSNLNNRLVCISDGVTPGRHCVSAGSFTGAVCAKDSDCLLPEQKCFRTRPYGAPNALGECRLPCPPDGKCPTRGGFPHTCFAALDERSCYPGKFGLNCRGQEECESWLVCQDVQPEQRLGGRDAGAAEPVTSSRICTVSCETDEDCDHFVSAVVEDAYCENHVCRQGAGAGGLCTRQRHCRGGYLCVLPDAGATGECVLQPG